MKKWENQPNEMSMRAHSNCSLNNFFLSLLEVKQELIEARQNTTTMEPQRVTEMNPIRALESNNAQDQCSKYS